VSEQQRCAYCSSPATEQHRVPSPCGRVGLDAPGPHGEESLVVDAPDAKLEAGGVAVRIALLVVSDALEDNMTHPTERVIAVTGIAAALTEHPDRHRDRGLRPRPRRADRHLAKRRYRPHPTPKTPRPPPTTSPPVLPFFIFLFI
jgi:hypothetical protein